MSIAIASGKGGTGKTTVATNLAVTAARAGRQVTYLDCDVEEPNGALFLQPRQTRRQPVFVPVPAIDPDKCVGCDKCGEICQYSAIVSMNRNVLVFPELCHGCGGCWLVCPSGAVSESQRQTGVVEIGRADGVTVVQGLLNIGEAMSPPVIAAVKDAAGEDGLCIVDAPPGTSCPVIESVRDAAFVLLVTEPTPFGLHDLKLAVAMVRALEMPFGVVINRAGVGDGETLAWCAAEGVDVLADIPDDRAVAEAYSRGEIACNALPEYRKRFEDLLDRITATTEAAT